MTSAQDRVTRGAALLDQYIPDWRSRVDLDQLDIASGDYCILGQLYGRAAAGSGAYTPYSYGIVDLARLVGIEACLDGGYAADFGDFDIEHGFMESNEESVDDEYDDNTALEEAWRAELAR